MISSLYYGTNYLYLKNVCCCLIPLKYFIMKNMSIKLKLIKQKNFKEIIKH